MLQQTQVARVAERFEPFMRKFPTPAALARASEQSVLAAWRGMGYYRRATLLRRAAIEIVATHRGRVPRTAAALRELPGVGRYTAGSIASIVCGAREAIVDGNVARVVLRVRGVELPLRSAAATALAWRESEALVRAARDPGALNEGLMELGATICTPVNPKCGACPLRARCVARSERSVDRIPAPPATRRASRVDVNTLVMFAARRRRVLLVQRPDHGMWASMWEPPSVERTPTDANELGGFRHLTTHRDFRFRVFEMEVPGRTTHVRVIGKGRTVRWAGVSELGRIPLSAAARRAIRLAI